MFDFNKQVLILRILCKLFVRDEVKDEIGTYQFVLNSIILNMSPMQVEVSALVFDIMTELMWHSDTAFEVVMRALEHFQEKKNFHYLFEPFIRVSIDNYVRSSRSQAT
jgi:hypothetical protein